MKQFKHDQLSTFVIGTELNEREWKSVFRQLVSMGLLIIDMENHGSIKLRSDYKAVLNSDDIIYLRHDAEERKKIKEKNKSSAKTQNNKSETVKLETTEEQELFNKLKAKRLGLAKTQNLPPYIIFHNTTLIEMAKIKPQSLEELGNISGVGNMKLEKYGEEFLKIILN